MNVTVFQGIKHIIVGTIATVADLGFFELLIWVLSFFFTIVNPLAAKAVSFLVSAAIKYGGNKYWVFQKYGREDWHKELIQFFAITLIGLLLDVGVFHYVTNVHALAGFSTVLWTRVAVIIAAAAAAAWNFLGYKFLVFKK